MAHTEPKAANHELDKAFAMALTGWFRNPEKLDDNTGKALRFMWDAGRLYDEAQRETLLAALKPLVREYMTATDTGPCMWCGGTPPKHINASSCPFANAEAAIEAAS
jgi:hypothetical protein